MPLALVRINPDPDGDQRRRRMRPRRSSRRRWCAWGFAALLGFTAIPIALLRWLPPPTSMFMLTALIEARLKGHHDFYLRQSWLAARSIAPVAALAVLAAEDQRFPIHRGFDFKQIQRALVDAGAGEDARGASTITQQVAKNLFLWSGHSWVRKGVEAWLTLWIEALWSKRRILEVYLNIAEFGDGIYGVGAASRVYFRHPASELSASEAALLAAVLPNPNALQVSAPSRYVRQRQHWIMAQMQRLGGVQYLQTVRW